MENDDDDDGDDDYDDDVVKNFSLTFNIVTYLSFSTKRSNDETFSPIAGIENCESFVVDDFSKMFRDPMFKHTRQIFSNFLFILIESTDGHRFSFKYFL